ncbi:uncharacterized protein LOC130698104 [Daphnia carinata]|uniref:uncharacterized protein LOC130698104 n=1 Tax=Daphnia carinata TaxID=120202 RepID=UPI002581121C|nr:uncharacterized protein LOC130698104 [Daphnia carinata]
MGDKILRYLAIANMFEGCLAVLLQLAVLVTLHDWVDFICIGFWGGVLMVLAGMWTLQRSPKKMITTASLAMFGGLCMVGFYSWNVSTVDCGNITTTPNGARGNWENDPDLCSWRLASDILFIIFGCFAIVINIFMAARTSMIIGDRRGSF